MPPPALGKTGWKVVLEDLQCQAMEKIQLISAAATSAPGDDPVFRGLSDSDVKDLMRMCQEQQVPLTRRWDDVKQDVFWIAQSIRDWNRLRAKEIRKATLKRSRAEMMVEDDPSSAGYDSDITLSSDA